MFKVTLCEYNGDTSLTELYVPPNCTSDEFYRLAQSQFPECENLTIMCKVECFDSPFDIGNISNLHAFLVKHNVTHLYVLQQERVSTEIVVSVCKLDRTTRVEVTLTESSIVDYLYRKVSENPELANLQIVLGGERIEKFEYNGNTLYNHMQNTDSKILHVTSEKRLSVGDSIATVCWQGEFKGIEIIYNRDMCKNNAHDFYKLVARCAPEFANHKITCGYKLIDNIDNLYDFLVSSQEFNGCYLHVLR